MTIFSLRISGSSRGFSTIEIMIAFALLALILTGVVLSLFSANYWQIASQTSNEALYIAKTHLEIQRGAGKGEFTLASSTPTAKNNDAACAAGGLCYFVTDTVTDFSSCSKYIKSQVDWQVQNYPTTTTSLFTTVTSPTEAIFLGGDCPLVSPYGSWASPTPSKTATINGDVTGLDVLEGYAYMAESAAPYLAVASTSPTGPIYQGSFGEVVAINGLDVARDEATGRTYAYVARNDASKQLGIVDVTDFAHPATTTPPLSLSGVTDAGGQGWRVFLYDRKIYIVTRFISGQPEFHVIDVSNPVLPVEKGSTVVNTSVNDLVVRDRKIGATTYRFAYLSTTLDAHEVTILDVTNPASISVVSTVDLPDTGCALANKPDGTAISLVGTMLYVGREHSTSCSAMNTIYAIDVTNPYSPQRLDTKSFNTNATVTSLKVSGGTAFISSASQSTAPSINLLDIDEGNVYAGRATSLGQSFQAYNLTSLAPISVQKSLSNSLTVFQSP